MDITSTINFNDGALVDSTGVESIEANPGNVEESDNYTNYSENQVETRSYSAHDILVHFWFSYWIYCLSLYLSSQDFSL